MLVTPSPLPAWSPGTAHPDATGGFEVDTADRRDVLAFYHTIYHASEGYAGRIQWTGHVADGVAGTTSAGFQNDVLRRVNFYRAMAGMRAEVTFSAEKGVKCQQAALMMSANNALEHNPPVSWTHYSAGGAEAAANANLSLGIFGPGAVDGQIRDDGFGNEPVGHRRWLLHARAREMATGDVPAAPGVRAANALWVIGNFNPPPAPRFIAWPNEGYTPDHLVPARWSLGYAGADFSAATVTMTRDGAAVPVMVVSRTMPNMAENTIVWEPQGLPAPPVAADTTYTVTVAGIVINGGPVTRSYRVTLFNPADLAEVVSIAGPEIVPVEGATYTFAPVAQADRYELRVSRGVAGTWTEGAEDASAAAVLDRTSASYPLRQEVVKRTGARAFHLTFPTVREAVQGFELDRVIVPGATGLVRFHDLFRYATTTSRLSLEVSADDGMSWTEIWGRAGNGSTSTTGWDAGFNTRTVSLAAYAGRPLRLRFVYRARDFMFAGEGTAQGVFVDDISVEGGVELVETRVTALGGGAAGFDLDAASAGTTLGAGLGYYLRVRPQVGTRWFPDGPLQVATVAGLPPLAPEPETPPDPGSEAEPQPDPGPGTPADPELEPGPAPESGPGNGSRAQTITFRWPAKIEVGRSYPLRARATSKLPLSYSLDNDSVGVIETRTRRKRSFQVLRVTGEGPTTLTASQPGNQVWRAAAPVEVRFTAVKKDQRVRFRLPKKIYAGRVYRLRARAGSKLEVTYAIDLAEVARIQAPGPGSTAWALEIIGPGTATVTAAQAGDWQWGAAEAVARTFTVIPPRRRR